MAVTNPYEQYVQKQAKDQAGNPSTLYKTAAGSQPQTTQSTRPTAENTPAQPLYRSDGEKQITDLKNQYQSAADDTARNQIAQKAKEIRSQYGISTDDPYYGNNDRTYVGQGYQAPKLPTNLLDTLTPDQIMELANGHAKQQMADSVYSGNKNMDTLKLLQSQVAQRYDGSVARLDSAKADAEKTLYQNDFEQRQRAKLDAIGRGMENSSVLDNMYYGINNGTTGAIKSLEKDYGMNVNDLMNNLMNEQAKYDLQIKQQEQDNNKAISDQTANAMQYYLPIYNQQAGLARDDRTFNQNVSNNNRDFQFQQDQATKQASQWAQQYALDQAYKNASTEAEKQRIAETIRNNKAQETIQENRYSYDKTQSEAHVASAKTQDEFNQFMKLWEATGEAPPGSLKWGVSEKTPWGKGDKAANDQLTPNNIAYLYTTDLQGFNLKNADDNKIRAMVGQLSAKYGWNSGQQDQIYKSLTTKAAEEASKPVQPKSNPLWTLPILSTGSSLMR